MTEMTPYDLTLTEARERMKALRATVGPKADVYCRLNEGGELITVTVCPFGIVGQGGATLHGKGNTLREAFDAAEAEWAARRSTYVAATIKKMALAIIEITQDIGECSTAALRATFSPDEIEAHSADALNLANEMAGNGPFSISDFGEGNKPVEEEDDE